eukprot:TRINITY_DN3453_c0_g2_i3.p1 TRINITY_DN3453_c0_g2~~TRINITY_DN3453_c0_g2_i3.p1  ORF type:complete len:2576 (+),score=641.01 TRINITY_DN3453_c0_g2_i3:652-7728(+)
MPSADPSRGPSAAPARAPSMQPSVPPRPPPVPPGPTASPSAAPRTASLAAAAPTTSPSVQPGQEPCDGGPTDDTRDSQANYSACVAKRTGERCIPQCRPGWQPSGEIRLKCSSSGRFDASTAQCKPNLCSMGPLWDVDPRATYETCNNLTSGQFCTPRCQSGYAGGSPGFPLVCYFFDTPDFHRTVHTYDAAGFKCIANNCTGGAQAGTLAKGANLGSCKALSSGDWCGERANTSNVNCSQGLRAQGGFQLVCGADGTFDAGAISCNPIICSEEQYVLSRECRECPPGMVSAVGRASASGPDTTCKVSFGLRALQWGFLWHEVFPLSDCDVLNKPDYRNMPYLLSPTHLSVGFSRVRYLSGTLVGGYVWVGIVAAAHFAFSKRFPQLPLHGLSLALWFWLLPGTAFGGARIFTEWYHDSSEVDAVDLILMSVTPLLTVLFLVLMWATVLRPSVFFARVAEVEPEAALWRFDFFFGKQTWEPCDIGLNFPRNKGLVFRWYGRHARWFMLCEACFCIIVSGIIAKLPSTRENCRMRNWPLVAVAAVWLVLVFRLRPMRSPLGNILLCSIALMQFLGVTSVARGLHVQEQVWYHVADACLATAAALQWAKTVHDALLLIHESHYTRQIEASGERAAKASSDLEGKRGDELVRAMHRLHATAGDLHPVAALVQQDPLCSPKPSAGTGMGERLAGGLDSSAAISMCTPEVLRKRMCVWQRDLADKQQEEILAAFDDGGKEQQNLLALARSTAFSVPTSLSGGKRAEHARAPGLLGWLEQVPRVWSEIFPEDTRMFYDSDIVCAGRHLPRQRTGFKEKVCCLSWNLRHILRRMLPDVIGNRKPWVHLLRERLMPAWPEATDGIVAVLVYTYETLRPGSNGRSREMQIYAEMNLAMREYGDPLSRAALAAARYAKHRKTVQFFLPLVVRLDSFLSSMRGAPGMVFRGISVRVAEQYRSGTSFMWGSFSSTSGKSNIARFFMKGAGSLFIAAHRRAVDVSYLSVFPIESELILPSNSVLTVMCKLPDTLLTLLSTNSDVLVVMEDVDGAAELTPRDAVDLALVAILESAFIYEDFCARYVEPQLDHRDREWFGSGRARALYGQFDAFLASPTQQVLLLTGDGGTGKTSTSLALTARLIRSARMKRPGGAAQAAALGGCLKKKLGGAAAERMPRMRSSPRAGAKRAGSPLVEGFAPMLPAEVAESYLPVFVHLPWAAGLLDEGTSSALTRHIQQQMYLDQGREGEEGGDVQLKELQGRRLVIFLDSVDELRGDVELIRRHTLLRRGGIAFEDWPDTKFVATCRGEFLEQHSLGLQHISPLPKRAVRSCMLPFNNQAVRTYVHQAVTIEARKLARALHGKPDGDTGEAVAQMRTVCLPPRRVTDLQRALHGRASVRVLSRDVRSHTWTRHANGVVAQLKSGLKGVGQLIFPSVPWVSSSGCSTITPGTVVSKINGTAVASGADVKAACNGAPEWVTVETVCPFANADAAVNAVFNGAVGTSCLDFLCRATNGILRRFHRSAEGLLGVPFVLYMVVSAAPELEKRPADLVAAEPRCQVYEVWIRQNIRDRLPRQPLLRERVQDPHLREEVVMAAATRLACSMFAAAEWHSTVGRCLRRVDHPNDGLGAVGFQRALLGCMPLRVEQIERDSSPLSWRHRTLMEYLIARAVAQEFLTARSMVLGSRPLQEHAPEVVLFFQERTRALRQLHPGRCDELEGGLRMLLADSDAACCANATVLLGIVRGMSEQALVKHTAAAPGLRRLTQRRSFRVGSVAPSRKPHGQTQTKFEAGQQVCVGVLGDKKAADSSAVRLDLRVYDSQQQEVPAGYAVEHCGQIVLQAPRGECLLGIGVQWRAEQADGGGVATVDGVEAGSPAALAEVAPGMRLAAVGSCPVLSMKQARDAVRAHRGASVPLLWQHGPPTLGAGHPFHDDAFIVDLPNLPAAAHTVTCQLTSLSAARSPAQGETWAVTVSETGRDTVAARWEATPGVLLELSRQGSEWCLRTAAAPGGVVGAPPADASGAESPAGSPQKTPRGSPGPKGSPPALQNAGKVDRRSIIPLSRRQQVPAVHKRIPVGATVCILGGDGDCPGGDPLGPLRPGDTGVVLSVVEQLQGFLYHVQGEGGAWWYPALCVEQLDAGEAEAHSSADEEDASLGVEPRDSDPRLLLDPSRCSDASYGQMSRFPTVPVSALLRSTLGPSFMGSAPPTEPGTPRRPPRSSLLPPQSVFDSGPQLGPCGAAGLDAALVDHVTGRPAGVESPRTGGCSPPPRPEGAEEAVAPQPPAAGDEAGAVWERLRQPLLAPPLAPPQDPLGKVPSPLPGSAVGQLPRRYYRLADDTLIPAAPLRPAKLPPSLPRRGGSPNSPTAGYTAL